MRFLCALAVCAIQTASACPFDLVNGESRQSQYSGHYGFIDIYTPGHPPLASGYPVIVWYHGYSDSLRPNTRMLQAITEGEVFLLVGADYGSRKFYEDLVLTQVDDEVTRLENLLDDIDNCVPIDREKVILAGYSQGGYAVSLIGERVAKTLAGMMILGAGRSSGGEGLPDEGALRGMPIFIAAGEEDYPHGESAEASARVYALLDAQVSLERWPGTNHIEGWSWYQGNVARTAGVRSWLNDVLDAE